jgi:hypothetical protein
MPESFAGCADGSPMQFHQAADERQADTEAALRAVERALGLHEHLEDGWKQIRRDAKPGVLDAEHSVVVLCPQRHHNPGTG